MFLGHQMGDVSERKLQWAAQLGVEHVACESREGIEREDGTWDTAGIARMQARFAASGLTIDVLALNLPSRYMTHQRFPGIMMGLPSRDAEIEVIKQNVRAAGEAGIPCLKYNLNLLGVPRTGRSKGRGGAMYSHFDIDAWPDHSLTEAGPMPAEKMWENITYFLERVVPVAEEAKVRLACHPHDPAVPRDTGLRGVHCVLGSVDGLKRFVSICESPYHGLNFCQGTVSEMCLDPRTEVLEAIRHFGAQGKIFMVHFRNIRGGFLHFDEVYPDEGDVDMLAALRAYREVGVNAMLCPDHVPHSASDPDGERQFSYCLGYTRALLQVAGPA
jgi:mannonate dehydratase